MIELKEALAAWGTDGFAQTLKREILSLPAGTLPLHLATTQGSIMSDGARDATILGFEDDTRSILCRLGIFFTETVGGCSCGDEPFTANGYCELQVRIDKTSAEATVALV